jgi:transposase InsO family protein/transposase-like protein
MANSKQISDLVDLYFSSPKMTINEVGMTVKPAIPYFKMYGAIAADIRFDNDPRRRSSHNHYDLDIKFKAIDLYEAGNSISSVCRTLDIKNNGAVDYWIRMYNLYGKEYFMKDKRSKPQALPVKPDIPEDADNKTKRIYELEYENAVLEAKYQHVKKCEDSVKSGHCPMNNSCKRSLIKALSPYAGKTISDLCKYFGISKSTYYYEIKDNKNRYLEHDKNVITLFEEDKQLFGKVGYRKVCDLLENKGLPTHEKRTRYILKLHNLQMNQRKAIRKWSSYKNDGNESVTNWLYDKESKDHFFKTNKPWELFVTDVTEFHVNGFKVYFSPMIDMSDSSPITWRISQHPDMDLMLGSLNDLIKMTPEGTRFILHSDQGSVYRTDTWKRTCENAHILQSMSRKGKSGDNAGAEGFFGRLKQEWFHKTDFTGYTYEQFVESLEEYLFWYNNKRIQRGIGKMSPRQYREKLQLEKVA